MQYSPWCGRVWICLLLFGVGACSGSKRTADATPPANTPITPPITPPTPSKSRVADIAVDTNRDGQITHDDDVNEDTWTATRGAIFVANVDDDDRKGAVDASDQIVNGGKDIDDLVPVLLRQADGLTSNDTVYLTVTPDAAAKRVRLFGLDGANKLTSVYRPGAQRLQISATRLQQGDVQLWLEAIEGRSVDWDGTVALTLVFDAAGQKVSSNTATLRAAPVVFPADTQPAHRVYVMKVTDPQNGPNLDFYNDLAANLKTGINLTTVSERDYFGDRWVQDNMQTGYQEWPAASGRKQMPTYLQTQRPTGPQGLEHLLPQHLLGPDLGYMFPGGQESSHNYGGNLEVAPPHPDFPLGRIVVGGGDLGSLMGVRVPDHMARQQRQWLDAQEVQGPSIEISTEWLAVGHVDEILLFVADRHSANGRAWKVIMAAPHLARQQLAALQSSGHGDLVVFRGRRAETTVAGILNNAPLMAVNQAAQARIDGVRVQLKQALALQDADFLEVPVLFESADYNGVDLAVAYNPGMDNLLLAGDTLFIPDPEGPDPGTGDVWKTATTQALEPLGLALRFENVFESYHELMGEVHCGTNVEHDPYAKAWWLP